jgi:hypothetical protein
MGAARTGQAHNDGLQRRTPAFAVIGVPGRKEQELMY